MHQLKNITLEISLKPFKKIDHPYIEGVCRKVFEQWKPLLAHADMVSVMMWSADGSEILEYKGDLDESFEWAQYIGGANPREDWDKKRDPEGIGLHTTYYNYIENPPVITYGIQKLINETIKRIGFEITGKPVRVGATFDPGPEFAKSEFKYTKHEEICMGDTMGKKSFVCCYGILHEDKESYAGSPEGIPEGTPFGTFFGRQCEHFLKDLSFDYLWLSNGFGFGTETWGTTGAIFDGDSFKKEKLDDTQKRILEFWKLFRQECPDIRIETRGTNLSVGIDLASDGVNLKAIYEGGFNMLPPPNSPWAALNGDFGLELAGYMSRISELPQGEDYLFRFYIHDPWWMNSPWIDRYEGQPHDIYLPLATARVNEEGKIQAPGYLNFLTIDNSLGEMPDQVPNEVIPHLIKAYETFPDEASPIMWVYPFREYFDNSIAIDGTLEKAFFEDWFIRSAINNGLPLSTVVSTDNYIKSLDKNPDIYKGVVIVTPVPFKGSRMEQQIIETAESGGKIILYGSLTSAGDRLLKALNVKLTSSVGGEMKLHLNIGEEELSSEFLSCKIKHGGLLSNGLIDTVLEDESDVYTKKLSWVERENENRIVGLCKSQPDWFKGKLIWIRGTSSNDFFKGQHLLTPHNTREYFPAEALVRLALREFDYHIDFVREVPESKTPIIMVHRNKNAFYFSGYMPDTTVKAKFKFPLGAPLFLGSETKLTKGYSVYNMPRAWRAECRVFIEQEEDGILSVKECCPVSFFMRRRVHLTGLKNATVRILPETGFEETTELLLNSDYPYIVGEKLYYNLVDTPWGKVLEAKGITGDLMISTPFSANDN